MLSGSRPDFLLSCLLPWNYNVTATMAFWSFVWREPDSSKPLFQVGWRAGGAGPLSRLAGRFRPSHLVTLECFQTFYFSFSTYQSEIQLLTLYFYSLRSTWDTYFDFCQLFRNFDMFQFELWVLEVIPPEQAFPSSEDIKTWIGVFFLPDYESKLDFYFTLYYLINCNFTLDT